MPYRLLIGAEARERLRALPKVLRRRIGRALDRLERDFAGDVKKLAAKEAKYRLRVGDYRVLFTLEIGTVFVYAVKQRKTAYD